MRGFNKTLSIDPPQVVSSSQRDARKEMKPHWTAGGLPTVTRHKRSPVNIDQRP
jgi:hypothetical protein